jgi:hypothetical protein
MGFTCVMSMFGLPSLLWYVTIAGAFQIKKGPTVGLQGVPAYILVYTVQYKTNADQPTISSQDRCFSVGELPADLWAAIYDDIKKNLDPLYNTDGQSLEFTDC